MVNNIQQDLIDFFTNSFSFNRLLINKIVFSFFIILFLWIIRQIIMAIVWKNTEKVKIRYRWKKTSGHITLGLTIIFLAMIWMEKFDSFATFLGIVSAGLVLVLRDPVANLTGWLFIISRRFLEVGDRIEIDQIAGDVIDINIFYFTLMEIGNWVNADQSTGRIIHIPNSFVLNKSFANYTKGLQFIWNEIPVTITFESDWLKAKKKLQEIIEKYEQNESSKAEQKMKEAAKRFYINYSKFTPIVYTKVIDYGISLTIRYLCEPRYRRQSESDIWEIVLKRFKKYDDIDFAYPTQRFYNNLQEGKVAQNIEEDKIVK